MSIDGLDIIKGRRWIYSNKKYIVITGKDLWILRKDLCIVCCRKDISNVYKIAFPTDDIMLTGQGKKASYRLIKLDDGTDIYTWPLLKMEHSLGRFALSHDKTLAYDCFDWRGKEHLVKINLQTGDLDVLRFPQGLRTIDDMMCDKEGFLCLLESQYEEDGYARISVNGIQSLHAEQITANDSCNLKYQWHHSGARIAKYFLGDTGYILTNDLFMYNPKTAKGFHLLENESTWSPPAYRPSGCWTDDSRHLVFLMYANVNVALDWDARKIVALYRGSFAKGHLVGDEYWISSDNGIRKLPFPLIEHV